MTTALLIHDDKLGEIKAQFVTTPILGDNQTPYCQCVLHQCGDSEDKLWVPINILATNTVPGTEIQHHLDVRRDAIANGHYVPEYSTDVEELNKLLYGEEE